MADIYGFPYRMWDIVMIPTSITGWPWH